MRTVKECWQALVDAFPDSFINHNNELIAHFYSNTYLCLGNCNSEFDIQCKVLEWFSRPAHKTAPYRQEWRNKRFHEFMWNGVNKFLGTKFTEQDMSDIYDVLGNAIHHELTVKFVNSGYDFNVLKEGSHE